MFLLGWRLALLAKTEWSGYTVSPLGLFSAASRGTRNERGQRVTQSFRGLWEKTFYHFFLYVNTVYCVCVHVCVCMYMLLRSVSRRQVIGLSDWWSIPKSQTVPVRLPFWQSWGMGINKQQNHNNTSEHKMVSKCYHPLTCSPEYTLPSLGWLDARKKVLVTKTRLAIFLLSFITNKQHAQVACSMSSAVDPYFLSFSISLYLHVLSFPYCHLFNKGKNAQKYWNTEMVCFSAHLKQ